MPPQSTFQTICCQNIAYPDPFVAMLHTDAGDSVQTATLQRFGLTVPLLVWQNTPERYLLLAGYTAFEAIVSQEIETAICQVLPQSTPLVDRYALQILHGLTLPQASPILQAYLMQEAQQQLPEKELLPLLSLMGYKPQRSILDELLALLHLAPPAVLAVHQGILSPKAAKLCQLLSRHDQETVVQLLQLYRPGGSKQLKLIEMVTDLSRRNNRPIQEFVGDWLPGDQGRLPDNVPQRLQGLLQSLSSMCWPEKTRLEKGFQQFVQALHLPEGGTLQHSPSFEDDSVELCLRFANKELFLENWNRIKTLIRP